MYMSTAYHTFLLIQYGSLESARTLYRYRQVGITYGQITHTLNEKNGKKFKYLRFSNNRPVCFFMKNPSFLRENLDSQSRGFSLLCTSCLTTRHALRSRNNSIKNSIRNNRVSRSSSESPEVPEVASHVRRLPQLAQLVVVVEVELRLRGILRSAAAEGGGRGGDGVAAAAVHNLREGNAEAFRKCILGKQ